MTEDEKKKVYAKINALWKNARDGDLKAKFCIDYASYVYTLMVGDPKTDDYWSLACDVLGKIANDYSGSGGIESQWAQMSLLVAQKISRGEQYVYTWKGV